MKQAKKVNFEPLSIDWGALFIAILFAFVFGFLATCASVGGGA